MPYPFNIAAAPFIHIQTVFFFLLGQALARLSPPGQGNGQPRERERQKVIVFKTEEIGDFVLASAFLRELRRMLPEAQITLAVNPTVFNLAERCPYVNDIILYHRRPPLFLRPLISPFLALRLGYGTLRRRNYGMALLPRWDVDGTYAAYAAYFSQAQRRIGYQENIYDQKRMMNRGFDLLFTELIGDSLPKHEVEKTLDCLRHLGGRPASNALEVWTDADDAAFAENALTPVAGQRLIALCPGSGAKERRWPADGFIALGRWWEKTFGAAAIIIGGKEDRPLGLEIKEGIGQGTLDLTGRTTLRQTAAILKRCHLYVGNDTGAMHMAAAAGLPVVEISPFPVNGPSWHWNSPRRFGPWQVAQRVLQPDIPRSFFAGGESPQLGDIRDITVERVQKAVCELCQPASARSSHPLGASLHQEGGARKGS